MSHFSKKVTVGKVERESLDFCINGICDKNVLTTSNAEQLVKTMKPEFLHIPHLFDHFEKVTINALEEKAVVEALSQPFLSNANSQLGICYVLCKLICKENKLRDRHLRAIINYSGIVPFLFNNLESEGEIIPEVAEAYLTLLQQIAIVDSGRQLIYDSKGLDKLILLLYNSPPENVESLLVEILALFYNDEKYYNIFNMKSEIAHLQNLIEQHKVTSEIKPIVKVTGIEHKLEKTFFKRFTFCDYCGEFIWGMFKKQGYSCSECGFAIHKRCSSKAPANCKEEKKKDIKRPPSLLTQKNVSIEIIAKIMKWAHQGKLKIHREIERSEVTFIKEIYHSSLCTIWTGQWKNQIVAIKEFDKENLSFSIDDLNKEVALQCITKHPNILRCYGANTLSEKPFIVMKFYERGSLRNVLDSQKQNNEPINLQLIISMLIECVDALAFLHSKNIIHRDVKPENFLVTDDFRCICMDFGISRLIDSDFKMTVIGTPVYMAPEVMNLEKYTEKADIYSFALVMNAMFTREVPYKNIGRFEIHNSVVEKKIRPVIPSTCPDQLKNLIENSWDPEPDKRPSFKEILIILWAIKDPKSGEKVMQVRQRLSEAVLALICEKNLLRLRDLYSASQVCKGWNIIIKLFIKGLQEYGNIPQPIPLQSPQKKEQRKWEKKFIKRHTKKNLLSTDSVNTSVGENELHLALAHTLGNKSTKLNVSVGKSKEELRKEMMELKNLFDAQKKLEEDLNKFKKQYELEASKRILRSSEPNKSSENQ